MSNSWDEMRKAKEEAFFKKQNDEALIRVQRRAVNQPRLSPITGKPMEQITVMGVVLDRCTESGGVWLDAGELEQLINISKGVQAETESDGGWIDSFFDFLKPKK
jgi:hypothetical protein